MYPLIGIAGAGRNTLATPVWMFLLDTKEYNLPNSMALIGSTNEEMIWNYLKAKGLNDYGVAGLMGNLYAESGLNPKNLQNSYEKSLGYTDDTYTAAVDSGLYGGFVNDAAGYGLAQWTYWSRKQALLAYCMNAGASIGDLGAQLNFLIKELSESYPGVLNTLKNASSVLEASNAVLLKFERPADQSASVQSKRASYGQSYYDRFSGSTQEIDGGGSMTAVERLIATAMAEEGYLEKASNSQLDSKEGNAGRNNYTKYARDLDNIGGIYNGKKNGFEWCDVFVDWVFIKTFGVELGMKLLCQEYGGAGAGCTYSAQYYKNKGQFYSKNPQPGDQIFFTNNGGESSCHTGLVIAVSSSKVTTIEGNTSSAAGVVANGGCVRVKYYSLTDSCIYGYGRPDWSLVDTTSYESDTEVIYQGKIRANGGLNCRTEPISGSILMTYPDGSIISITKERNGWGYTGVGWVCLDYVTKIEDSPVVPSTPGVPENPTKTEETEDDDMDVTRFEQLWEEMRKGLQDNDSSQYSQAARDWATSTGLIVGGDPNPDGSPNYMWQDLLTREQFVTVLYRYAQMMGKV